MTEEVDEQVIVTLFKVFKNKGSLKFSFDNKFDDENHDDVETYSSDKKKHPFARESNSSLSIY